MIINRASNFIDAMWLMGARLNCEHFWYDDILSLQLMNQKNILEFRFDRQCLETRSRGARNTGYHTGDRVVNFPKNMYERFHQKNWTVLSFQQKYNMTLNDQIFCNRFQRQNFQRYKGD